MARDHLTRLDLETPATAPSEFAHGKLCRAGVVDQGAGFVEQ